MTLDQAKSRLSRLRRWEPNPVVVKELRQAVRGWAVTGMLMFFLAALFVAMLFFLANQSLDIGENTQAGANIFGLLVFILAISSILFIPLYVGIRMAAERQENNADLLYISTLSPARIIFGKVLCGAYMILLFFSACMPFMAFTNLLRGVDLPTIFLVLAFLFAIVGCANMVAIFIACLPVSRPFKILLGLGQLILSVWTVGVVVVTSLEMMRGGVGSMVTASTFWQTTATIAGIVAMIGGLLFVLSVALISTPSANRALLPRIYITAAWLLSGLIAAYWAWRDGDASRIVGWSYVSLILLVGALVVTISNSDHLSQRVRRRIPRSRPLRALAFLFFNGAAGGLIWVSSLMVLTFLGTFEWYARVADKITLSSKEYSTFIETYPPLLIYALAYALTALFLHRTFLPRRRATMAGVLAAGLFTAAAAGPSIVLFFMNELSWRTLQRVQLGNPSNVLGDLSSDQRMQHLYFASAWLAIALVVTARWFVRQVNDFRSAQKAETAPLLTAIPPAVPQ